MKNFLIFIGGIAVGGAASYFITSKLLNDQHEAEIDEIREMYKCKPFESGVPEVIENTIEHSEEKGPTLDEYRKRIEEYKNNSPAKIDKATDDEDFEEEDEDDDYFDTGDFIPDEEDKNVLYENQVISQEHYEELVDTGECDTPIHWDYFDDGVMADDVGYRVTEDTIKKTVGSAWKSKLKDADCVYVLNNMTNTIYEIGSAYGTYDEFISDKPYLYDQKKGAK